MMVTVGMDLRSRDFLRVRDYPWLVPSVVIGQWVALVITTGLISRSLALSDEVTGGVLLVAAAPAAVLSCFYAQLAAGDLALATTLAAVSNALAFLATPLIATVGFHLFLRAGGQFDLPLVSVAQQTLVGLLLPLLAGMVIRHRLSEHLDRWRSPIRAVGLVAVVSVLAAAVVDECTTISAQFADLLRAAIVLTLAMLTVGIAVARIASPNARPSRAALGVSGTQCAGGGADRDGGRWIGSDGVVRCSSFRHPTGAPCPDCCLCRQRQTPLRREQSVPGGSAPEVRANAALGDFIPGRGNDTSLTRARRQRKARMHSEVGKENGPARGRRP